MVNGTEVFSFNQWANNFSMEEILKGNFDAFAALFYLIIMIAIYAIVVYHFYRYIARRDCFKPSKRKHSTTIGFLKYFFLYPFVAIIFFMGFSLILISLTKDVEANIGYSISQILSLSFAIIVAIRITAYYTEDLSKDVAKMLPFAILGVFLVDSTYFQIDTVIARISTLPQFVNTIVQFLILIILVEWILRVALFIRYKIKPKKEEPVPVEAIKS
jgi:hypothetical protein